MCLHRETFTNRTFYVLDCAKRFPVLLCTIQVAQGTSRCYFALQKLAQSVLPSITLTTKLAQSTSQHNFILQSIHKILPSTTSYYNACTHCTAQCYFVLRSLHRAFPTTTLYCKTCTKYFLPQELHKVLPVRLLYFKFAHRFPSTTLYFKACTKYFPAQLCTTKLLQNISQYYLVPQSLHKVFLSTTLYYKTCAKCTSQYYFYYKLCTKALPITTSTTKLAQSISHHYFAQNPSQYFSCTSKLAQSTPQYDFGLCTSKVAQSTSQYYSVLQDFHKVLPSTNLYYKTCPKCTSQYHFYCKTCTKHFPAQLRTTKHPQNTFQYYFVL